MKFNVDQPELERLIVTVARAVDNRPTLPVMANLLLVAKDGHLYATGTNVEMTIRSSTPAEIEVEGEVTLPAADLLRIVAACDKRKPVSFALDENTVSMKIKNGSYKSSLRGISANQFPPTQEFGETQSIVLPREALVKGFERTIYAIDHEQKDFKRRGLVFHFVGKELRLQANSGIRFAQSSIPLKPALKKPLEVIVFGRVLNEVKNVLAKSDSQTVTMGIGRRVRFDDGMTTVDVQTLDGNLAFDLLSKFPDAPTTEIEVDTESLKTAINRVRLFAEDANNAITLSGSGAMVAISAESAERGRGEDIIDSDVRIVGENMSMLVNARFLLETINSFSSERITLCVYTSAYQFLLVRSETEADMLATISPMSPSGKG